MPETQPSTTPGTSVVVTPLAGIDPAQVARRPRVIQRLADREPEINAAIQDACRLIQVGAEQASVSEKWQLSTIEATFSITLGVDAGVLISKASAEATFEVKVTVERR